MSWRNISLVCFFLSQHWHYNHYIYIYIYSIIPNNFIKLWKVTFLLNQRYQDFIISCGSFVKRRLLGFNDYQFYQVITGYAQFHLPARNRILILGKWYWSIYIFCTLTIFISTLYFFIVCMHVTMFTCVCGGSTDKGI